MYWDQGPFKPEDAVVFIRLLSDIPQGAWSRIGWIFIYVVFPVVIPVYIMIDAIRRFRMLQKSLTTRFIGTFPDHLDNIISLVAGAHKEIHILADCLDYGSFRDLDSAKKLEQTICASQQQSKLQGHVKYLLWGKAQTMSRASKFRNQDQRLTVEFSDAVAQYISKLKRVEPKFAKVFSAYIADVEKTLASKELSAWKDHKYLSALQLAFHELQRMRFLRAGINPTVFVQPDTMDEASDAPREPEVFFWIADKKNAVFLLPTAGEDALAFETRDRDLIMALETIFQSRLAYVQLQADRNRTREELAAAWLNFLKNEKLKI